MAENPLTAYKLITQRQLLCYNRALLPIGFGAVSDMPLLLSLAHRYDMLLLDQLLAKLLDQLLAAAPLSKAKATAVSHMFKGAMCMRAARDFNISTMSPRQRLLAGYRGLYAHAQRLRTDVQLLESISGNQKGGI